jgi:predicted esterase
MYNTRYACFQAVVFCRFLSPRCNIPISCSAGSSGAVAHSLGSLGLKGKLDYYTSNIDGEKRPYAICATSESDERKPLVIVVSPGAPTDAGPNEIRVAEQYAWYAKKNGKECITMRATGRGPGSVYQNYGEEDVFEAVRDAMTKYPIDPDRISVTGFSMGGAATWYLVSHYPDFFAAAAPMSGYCDYRLWEKPGGFTYPMQPWEEPSWQARSAAFLPSNFEHTAMWITHGEWDRSVGGGVPVAHSRKMYSLLKERSYNVKYTEVPKTGHSSPPELFEQVTLWLIQQRKERNPRHIELTTYALRHNKSYWVTADQLEHYGERARLDARLTGHELVIQTENVSAFTAGPIASSGSLEMRIDGQMQTSVNLTQVRSFYRSAGHWLAGTRDTTREKRHGCSGPITDIFFDNMLLVPGASGTDEESNFNALMAGNLRNLFKAENGGLHRGGIRGSNTIDLVSLKDANLTEDQIHNNNLLLFGATQSNAILKRYANKLPLAFEPGKIRLGNHTFTGERLAMFAVFPHPENPGRYIAVIGGVTPDAVTWGSHLSYQLLPDYVVFDRGRMLDWGFWDNSWKHLVSWQAK